jgi:hypothetical protein
MQMERMSFGRRHAFYLVDGVIILMMLIGEREKESMKNSANKITLNYLIKASPRLEALISNVISQMYLTFKTLSIWSVQKTKYKLLLIKPETMITMTAKIVRLVFTLDGEN